MIEYSEKEKALIDSFGFSHMIAYDYPYALYRIIAEDCFINNKTGKNVESLRRILSALRNCTVYRMTKEFDDLIE